MVPRRPKATHRLAMARPDQSRTHTRHLCPNPCTPYQTAPRCAGKVDVAGYLFPGQGPLQLALLFAAFVAAPWMLLPKPLILRARHKRQQAEAAAAAAVQMVGRRVEAS